MVGHRSHQDRARVSYPGVHASTKDATVFQNNALIKYMTSVSSQTVAGRAWEFVGQWKGRSLKLPGQAIFLFLDEDSFTPPGHHVTVRGVRSCRSGFTRLANGNAETPAHLNTTLAASSLAAAIGR